MTTDNLRAALRDAGLSADELAELVEVDTRTVRRWLSGRLPYRRHRGKIARALNTTEQAIWPELRAPAPPAAAVATEIVDGFARSDDVGAPTTEQLITTATERIELLDDTLHRLITRPGVPQLLAARAGDGCRVRILVSQPGAHLAPLLGHDGIELRAPEAPVFAAVHRVDDHMLISLSTIGPPDEPPPLLHLVRRGPGGLFDRFADHFEHAWEDSAGPIKTHRDLDAYVDPGDLDDQAEDSAHTPSEPDQIDRQLTATPAPSGRRWPRRPPGKP